MCLLKNYRVSSDAMSLALNKLKKRPCADGQSSKPKKKIDRFDGLTEEEVQKYTLDDILEPDLDLVFVGINPSLMAAHRGRYYAGPGNHFYKLLHESQLVPRFVSFEEDRKLLNYKIGLTNIVARATRSSADLKKPEIKEGTTLAREKIKIFKPRIAVFNGKCIYEVFANKTGKSSFNFGLQPERVGQTAIWVVPSSSARCAHFPRMVDKLHFYTALKKFLSFVKGEITQVDIAEFVFEGKCKQSVPSTSKMWRRKNVSAFLYGGRVANKDTVCHDTSDENLAAVNSTEFIVTEILDKNDVDREEKIDKVEISSKANCCTDNIDAEKSKDTNCCEEKSTSQKIKSQKITSPCENVISESTKKEKNSKRTLKRSVVDRSVSRTFRVDDNNGNSTDFLNMIKRRLSEKKEAAKIEETIVETSSQPHEEGKKLKYGNLRLNRGKKILGMENCSTERSSELNDSVSAVFSN